MVSFEIKGMLPTKILIANWLSKHIDNLDLQERFTDPSDYYGHIKAATWGIEALVNGIHRIDVPNEETKVQLLLTYELNVVDG